MLIGGIKMEELLMDISNTYHDLRSSRIYGQSKKEIETKISEKLRQFERLTLLSYSIGIFVIGTLIGLVISEISFMSWVGTIFLLIGIFGFINLLVLAVRLFEKKDISSSFLAKLINLKAKKQAYIKKNPELDSLVESKNNYDRKISESTKLRHSSIPQEYRDEYTLIWLFIYLTSNRANTLGESINIFEQEEHQARLERKEKRNIPEYTHVLEIMSDWSDEGDKLLRRRTL